MTFLATKMPYVVKNMASQLKWLRCISAQYASLCWKCFLLSIWSYSTNFAIKLNDILFPWYHIIHDAIFPSSKMSLLFSFLVREGLFLTNISSFSYQAMAVIRRWKSELKTYSTFVVTFCCAIFSGAKVEDKTLKLSTQEIKTY